MAANLANTDVDSTLLASTSVKNITLKTVVSKLINTVERVHLLHNSIGQCWNWPKRTGGRCRNFAQGLKFKPIFTQKWAYVDTNWGFNTPTPRQFQPCSRPRPSLASCNAAVFATRCLLKVTELVQYKLVSRAGSLFAYLQHNLIIAHHSSLVHVCCHSLYYTMRLPRYGSSSYRWNFYLIPSASS